MIALEKLSASQAAARFPYVFKTRQRRDRNGEVGTRLHGSRREPVLTAYGPAIAAQVAQHPSITLADLRAWLGREYRIAVVTTTLWIAVRRLGTRHSGIGRPACFSLREAVRSGDASLLLT